MRVVLGLALLLCVDALTVKLTVDDEDECNAAAQQEVKDLIEKGQYEKLRGHKCLDKDEDPEDAVEIFGSPKSWVHDASDANEAHQKSSIPGCNDCHHRLPTLLFLAADHSGSTSLACQMNDHPELSFGAMKEHTFFTKFHTHRNDLNLEKYKKQFHVHRNVTHAFDATPNTLWLGDESNSFKSLFFPWHQPGVGAVQKVKEVLGEDLKMIVMVRDPFYYLLSRRRKGRLVEDDGPISGHNFPANTCYGRLLQTWLQVFPRQNFLFLSSEVYFRDPQATLDQVFEFAGVQPMQLSEGQLHPSGRRRNQKAASQNLYEAFHSNPTAKECKDVMESLTGLEFNWHYVA